MLTRLARDGAGCVGGPPAALQCRPAVLRFVPHILLIYLALGLQRGLDGALRYSETRVDIALIAAMFVAACLPAHLGPLAAALAGLAVDLTGRTPLGIHALSFGLAGLIAARLPANAPPRLLASILAGVVVAGVLRCLIFAVRGVYVGDVRPYFWGLFGTILLTGLVAAALTPLLYKWRRPFIVRDRR